MGSYLGIVCLPPSFVETTFEKTLFSWEAYHNIGTKPGRRGQTLFRLEKMHKELGNCLSHWLYLHG